MEETLINRTMPNSREAEQQVGHRLYDHGQGRDPHCYGNAHQ